MVQMSWGHILSQNFVTTSKVEDYRDQIKTRFISIVSKPFKIVVVVVVIVGFVKKIKSKKYLTPK